jgi:hypothetical protein
MKTSWPHTARIILFSALLGGAAGILTTALTTNYLADYALQLGQFTEPLRLSEQRPIAFPSSYGEALELVKQDAIPAVVHLIDEPTVPKTLSETNQQVAIMITSDGWMMAFDDLGFTHVLTDGGICEIQKRVHDVMNNVYFYQCTMQSMPVVGFGSGLSIIKGEHLFVVGEQGSLVSGEASSIQWGSTVSVSSDIPSRRIILSVTGGGDIGDMVFDLSGKLVGVVEDRLSNGQLVLLPLEAILPALNHLLEQGEISRPALGLQVINLSHAIVDEALTRGRSSGALLYGPRAVTTGGAAFEAGLLAGDIILSINHQSVTRSTTLDELLLNYKAGDQVTLLIDRLGDEIEVKVTLGEWGN